MQDPEKAAEIIKRYEDTIKTKKKGQIKRRILSRKDLRKRKSLLSLSMN